MQHLKRAVPGSEVRHVQFFEMKRETPDGESQEIEVYVYDKTSAGPSRFECEVFSSGGHELVGEPAELVETAIASVNWSELDSPAPQGEDN